MPDAFDGLLPGTQGLVPADLNQSCFCITLDRGDLGTALGIALGDAGHIALRRAYQDGTGVLTPNRHNHAVPAHKRNLTLLSDPVALGALGVSAALTRRLAGIPPTRMVTPPASG